MTWAGVEDLNDDPKDIIIPSQWSKKVEKREFIEREIGSFVKKDVLSEFYVEKALREEIEKIKETESTQRLSEVETVEATLR
jgi:phage terminase small subunit